jgi:hypothetical protein
LASRSTAAFGCSCSDLEYRVLAPKCCVDRLRRPCVRWTTRRSTMRTSASVSRPIKLSSAWAERTVWSCLAQSLQETAVHRREPASHDLFRQLMTALRVRGLAQAGRLALQRGVGPNELLQLTGVALQRRGCHYRSGWRKGRRSWVVGADTGPAGRATIVATEVARELLVGRNSDASEQGV